MPASGGERRSERHIIRSGATGIDSVVRRLLVDDADARSDRLRLLQAEGLIGFVPIQYAEVTEGTLEVAEDLVDGVTVADAMSVIHDEISVNVALSICFDLAQTLHRLHCVESGARSPLIHGAVTPDNVVLTSAAGVFLSGLSGAVGDPAADVAALMGLMRKLLEKRARSKEGALLLDRLTSLTFTNCRDLARSIEVYLARQDEKELRQRRLQFATSVLELTAIDDDPTTHDEPAIDIPSESMWKALEPDYSSPFDIASDDDNMATLAARDLAEIGDIGDEESQTAVDELPDLSAIMTGVGDKTVEAAPEPVDLERSRMDSRLNPLPQPETDVLDDGARVGLLGRAATGAVESESVVVGNYNVVASIGRGGMGEIYLAREKKKSGGHGKLVALKVLAALEEDDAEALDMLLDEAAIMARITHDNVLRVIDFGRDRGRYFLATEYLEGRPLVRVMIEAYNREQGIDYGVIASIGADAANGLFAAHTATTDSGRPLDVVHRDISPQNIFVTYSGTSKVIDFGVARATERVSKTEIGLVKGKVAYMSPEQAEGRQLDARSDVFSLGVCLWEMTAGRRLFKKDNEYDTLLAVQSEPIPKPTVVRGDPNPVLDHIILGALERDRDRRTPTARELALQLIDYASGVGVDDRGQTVADLLDRLFGDAAKKERELIDSLESRSATSAEAAELRELSGVSSESVVRRITWVAEPDGLDDLDGFGSVSQEIDEPTGKRVLDRVHRIQAERRHSSPGRSSKAHEDLADTADAIQPIEVSESAAVQDPFDAEPTRRLDSSRIGDDPSREVETLEVTEELDDDADLDAAIEVSDSFQLLDAEPVQETAPAAQAAKPIEKKRRWPIAVAIVSVLAIAGGAGAVFVFDEDPHPASDRPPPPAADAVGTIDRVPTTTIATGTTASDQRTIAVEPEVLEVPTTTIASRAVEVTIESFVQLFEGDDDTDVSESQGTYLVADSEGGTFAFDDEAKITRVESGPIGFVIETKSKSLTSIGWVGRVGEGGWRTRALSINDCPASVGIEASTLTLRYGGQEVRMPHGGGDLYDVQMDVPAAATRLEVDPLGLSFGEADDESAAIHCKAGWWGSRVVLRRLSVGRYTLRWFGGGVAQTATLDVRPDGVDGGKLVRRSTGE